MLNDFPDLFDDRAKQAVSERATVPPITPRVVANADWPPNYAGVYAWRMQTLERFKSDAKFFAASKVYYSTRPAEFIMHWMDTYNPRMKGNKWVPFIFFKRQKEFIDFLQELIDDQENGLVEKARDMGLTWLGCAYSVWAWLFVPDSAIGWGSRKEALVDKLGDPDSIFEKMRLIVKRMPDLWLPPGFNPKAHATHMKLINPVNGSIVAGEAGDNIGRGGRKSAFLKDEAAHYDRPEKIEAALGDNTNVQVDISSVNGLGNVFHRRREAGIDWQPGGDKIGEGFTRVFVMDWRDHPEKTQKWYDDRKAKYEREGMAHVFAQEVDRNYSAAVQNTVIPYEWLTHCVDAHLTVPYLRRQPSEIPNIWQAGMDVADEGIDRNALTKRQWIIWRHCEEWGSRDPGEAARKAVASCRENPGIVCQYDSIGIGSTVKSEFNRLIDAGTIKLSQVRFVPWAASAEVQRKFERLIPDDDESPLNKDFFGNIKAQAWWSMRSRVYKTFKAVTEGDVYPADELVSFDSAMPLLHQLLKELAQPTSGLSQGLRQIVNKKPDGTKSPNLADAGIMMYFPIEEHATTIVGTLTG